jgi:GDPmannose 4,6-dehydratase
MLQHDHPDDYVLGTGDSHSVREFVEEAFSYVGLDWREYVQVDPQYYRPSEVDCLLADTSKANRELSWRPQVGFRQLVRIMVDAELHALNLPAPGKGIELLPSIASSVGLDETVFQVRAAVQGAIK